MSVRTTAPTAHPISALRQPVRRCLSVDCVKLALAAAALGLLFLVTTAHPPALAQATGTPTAAGGAQAGGLRDLPTVTIVTDGLDILSPGSAAIAQLAAHLADERSVRVLAIAGRGSADNLHDLLYFRGVDFAVINSDVFALPDLGSDLADARRRVRLVSPIHDRKVYLLARAPINRLEDLRGRPVAAIGGGLDGHSTARALLAIEGVSAELERLAPAIPLDAGNLTRFDAVILVGEEILRFQPAGSGLRLLPIAFTQRLGASYKPAAVTPDELGPLTGGQVVPTLERTTMLATFSWSQAHSRFPAIRTFLQAYFAALPRLREVPGSVWRQSNVQAAVAALAPHPLAVPARFLQPQQLAALSTAETVMFRPFTATPAAPALAAVPPAAPLPAAPFPAAGAGASASAGVAPASAATATAAAATAPPTVGAPQPVPQVAQPAPAVTTTGQDLDRLALAAVVRQPLADPKSSSGGLVIELLARALEAGAQRGAPRMALVPTWQVNQTAAVGAFATPGAFQLSAPWVTVDCERPNDLAGSASILCDEAMLSDPLMRVAFKLFAPASRAVALDTPQAREGRTVCAPQDTDPNLLQSAGRNWTAERTFTLMRRASLVECVAAVEAQEADAFAGIDFEALEVLNRLGLTQAFKPLAIELGTRGVHVAVARNHPQANLILQRINGGLQALKASDGYAASINRHLQAYWSASAQ